jgi:hypothetical protein|tara:strand:- start:1519 stop:3690 length:2172 start_codon:yes stop_codon:yes gene_type:complete
MRAAPHRIAPRVGPSPTPASSRWRSIPRRAPKTRVCASDERDALGGQDFIYSQRSGVSEDLFKGTLLGVDADCATGDLRANTEARDLTHLRGKYHVPTRFKNKFAAHVAKNLLCDDDANECGTSGGTTTRTSSGLRASGVPLLLGVWGSKGCGKSFSLELACRDMKIAPFMVSAGELEDPVAGEPGALLRRRYLAASKYATMRGVPTVLIINDLDAAVGRFKDDKYTVNNQIVSATLMNLCDNPAEVKVGSSAKRRAWDSREEFSRDEKTNVAERDGVSTENQNRTIKCARVPIIVTGNDFSRLYAPLTRTGRMDLWHWEPSRGEIAEMVHATFADDDDEQKETTNSGYAGIADAQDLVNAFPNQPLDFFTAVRSRCADDAIRVWLSRQSPDTMRRCLVGEKKGVANKKNERDDPDAVYSKTYVSIVDLPKQDVSLTALLKAGTEIATEQQHVLDLNLAREYVNAWTPEVTAGEVRDRKRARGLNARVPEARNVQEKYHARLRERELVRRADAENEALRETAELATRAASQMLEASAIASRKGELRKLAIGVKFEEAAHSNRHEDEELQLPWLVWDCVECYRKRQDAPTEVLFVDVRPRKDFNRETVKGAVSCPAAVVGGTIATPAVTNDVDGAVRALIHEVSPACSTVVVIGDGGGDGSYSRQALHEFHLALQNERATAISLVEMRDGAPGWLHRYTPGGKPRPRYVGYGKDNEETMFTASN